MLIPKDSAETIQVRISLVFTNTCYKANNLKSLYHTYTKYLRLKSSEFKKKIPAFNQIMISPKNFEKRAGKKKQSQLHHILGKT